MANAFITNQKIALLTIPLFRNTNAMLNWVNNEYVDEFAQSGAKAGYSVRIRKPVDFNVLSGPTAVFQDIVENYTTLTVATQKNVPFSISSADRTMQIDKFTERYIRPAVNNLAGQVAGDLMAGAEGGASSWSAKYDGSGNLVLPDQGTWLNAKAVLQKQSIETQQLAVIADPTSMANSVATFSTLFNSQSRLAAQYENGDITHAWGMDWMGDQTVIVHTTGTLAASGSAYTANKGWSFGTMNGANQTGSTLTVTALTGTLKKGDIISIAGVNAVNRVNKNDTGTLQTFTVTADVASSATSIPIYPPLTPAVAGNTQYQTVTNSPTTSAVLYCKTAASTQYRKNLVLHKKAVTFAMIDLEGQLAGADVSRANQDGLSLRVTTQYIIGSDQQGTRLDALYGLGYLMPEWIAVVPDPIS